MNKNLRLSFRRGDLIAIASVVALAVIVSVSFLSLQEAADNVQIYQDGRLVRTLSIHQNETVQIYGDYTNTISIQDGKVAIVETDCPGGDCMHTGWIGNAGRSIVCLPNRVEVRITGEAEVDFVVG